MDIVVRREGEIHVADWGRGARRCAVGRAGIQPKRREGDGITPAGVWPLRQVFFRPDRVAPPRTVLPVSPLSPEFGWCEAPGDPDYNRLVRLPHGASAEMMWREDALYDVVTVVGYNDSPVVSGAGSAIFVHLARPDFGPTQGCVALRLSDLLEALAQLEDGDRLVVEMPAMPLSRM